MTDATSVSNFLVRSLQQIDPRPLKGSELSVLVKTAFPDFSAESFGSRTLRDFIRKHATEIVEFSRAGMDVIYRLRATQERLQAESAAAQDSNSPLEQLTTNPRVWKTFATPDSPFRLFLIPETGSLRVLHPNAKPISHWREIPKISARVLLQIGMDFAADLPEVQKAVLVPLLEDPQWWIPYFERLQSLGLKSKWIAFRRRRIRDEFQRIIGADATSETSAVPHISPALPVLPLAAELATRTQSDLDIRRIAADVVQRMTESELRALTLPLGYVMDSLTTR